jgi:predicted amidohydrolase
MKRNSTIISAMLRITIIQSSLHWENIQANLELFSEKLVPLAGKTDLVLLPEMFTTGFTMNAPALAEEMDGQTMRWMAAKAAALQAAVAGSFIARENDCFYNRLVWMKPDGSFDHYDKRHLFTLAGEHRVYTPGTSKSVFHWKGWNICPLICYDLRFPVWSRNTEGYDLLLYLANWPEPRRLHWQHLLTARAIENQCYVAGVNRTGTDGKGLVYAGDSALVDFSGEILFRASGCEATHTAILSTEKLQEYRKNFQFLADKENFKIF